jgi:hypothetical protein
MKSHTVSKFVILFSAMTILTLGLSGCAILKAEDAFDDARAVADRIAGYSLPQGYREQFAVEMMDYQVVSLLGPEESSHIYLVQAPQGIDLDVDQLEQARIMDNHDTIEPKQMQVVENRPVVIRGQNVNLVIQEGLNSENQPYRSATALFEGRNGMALVSLSSRIDVWDAEMVDAFLTSLN